MFDDCLETVTIYLSSTCFDIEKETTHAQM